MKTDTQLRDDILAELKWDPKTSREKIAVWVDQAAATIQGEVTSYAKKVAVEAAVWRVHGVKAAAIELKVILPAMHARNDSDLAVAIERALEWDVLVPKHITAKVEGGWVTLYGDVTWQYQRLAAEKAVGNLMGVKGVSSELNMKPVANSADVRRDIHDALVRQADCETQSLQIEVNGSEVTLRGSVHSWAEKIAAQRAAWSAPGVAKVTSELSVQI